MNLSLIVWIAHASISFFTMAALYTEHKCGYRPGWLASIWIFTFNWYTTILLGCFLATHTPS